MENRKYNIPRPVRSFTQDKLRVEHLEKELEKATETVAKMTETMLEMANDLLNLKYKLSQRESETR